MEMVKSWYECDLASSRGRCPQHLRGPLSPSRTALTGQQPSYEVSPPSSLRQDRLWSTAGGLQTG